MDCSDVKKNCQPFLDQQLDPARRKAVLEHLQCCACCADTFRSEEQFLNLMKRCCEPRGEFIAPASFKARALQKLNAVLSGADRIIPLPKPAPVRMRGPMATAAACMLALTGMIAWQTSCTPMQCPLVRAAQHEHDNIIAGNRPTLAQAADPQVLSRILTKFMKEFPGVPDLKKCSLQPHSCGKVKIASLPEGIFVTYKSCGCAAESVTLMAVQTDKMPGGQQIVHNEYEFLAATHARHNILAWHTDSNGMLYMLVTKRDLRQSLDLAETARRTNKDLGAIQPATRVTLNE